MLLGLAELCAGIGAAVAAERCEPLAADGLFPAGDLGRLLDACPTPAARSAVVGIATALPFLDASEEICSGYGSSPRPKDCLSLDTAFVSALSVSNALDSRSDCR